MLPNINPTKTSAYKQLQQHAKEAKQFNMLDLFAQAENRLDDFSIKHDNFIFDYSKNIINPTTKKLLLDLANECKLSDAMEAFKSGECINVTENRPVMHMALRHTNGLPLDSQFTDVVKQELSKIRHFVGDIQRGKRLGYTAKQFRYVVNIGIGGSDLGPAMVTTSLKNYQDKDIEAFFVSNVDGAQLFSVLKKINPEETLFLIASKTFTTQETMANAHQARAYLLDFYDGNEDAIQYHFVAISTNQEAIRKFGIADDLQFTFWDWVGGRFSLWSSIGLSIALTIGYANFEQLLLGAEDIDKHFFDSPLERNIPTLMALISFWYTTFFDVKSEAILPYAQFLERFPAYLQQAIMESNGKNIDRNGEKITYPTCPVIWGEPGTNGQHAFYQLLHQGTQMIPIDFIGYAKLPHPYQYQHDILMANMLAQSQAFMVGKTEAMVRGELSKKNASDAQVNLTIPFQTFDGNKPSNTILFDNFTPYALGQLIALYEHKIFVQGIIWNIYSFDQWGVALGKKLANKILSSIEQKEVSSSYDASTQSLLSYYLKHK